MSHSRPWANNLVQSIEWTIIIETGWPLVWRTGCAFSCVENIVVDVDDIVLVDLEVGAIELSHMRREFGSGEAGTQ
jgi:hypothetical protein